MTTTSDKQVLLSMVKNQITDLEDRLNVLKSISKEYYKLADKSLPDSKFHFLALNDVRTDIRRDKKRIKRLAIVAKNLKKDIKEGSEFKIERALMKVMEQV